MKTNQIILVTAILLLAFALMGATGCPQKTSNDSPFIGGTKGLTISFAEQAPPSSVYDSGVYPFPVSVMLTNDGEWEVKQSDVQVRLMGIDPADFSLGSGDFIRQPYEDLLAKTKESDTGATIAGTTTSVEFPDLNYKNSITGNMQMKIYADVCYSYGTNVISQLCVKKDPTDTSSKVCAIEEDKPVYSSSAPVQVTSFHQSIGGRNMLRFTFTIKKTGTSTAGAIFTTGSKCNTEGMTYENKVWVEVNVPEMPGTKCSGLQGGTDSTGFVTLYGGERPITCTQPISTETDYVKNLAIKLTYDYRDQVSQTLEVKHSQ